MSNAIVSSSHRVVAQRDYDQAVRGDYRRNIIAFIGFDFLWGLNIPFAFFLTVVPAYMTELRAPKVLIGIIVSLPMTMCPLQLIISHYFRNKPRKLWLMASYIACVIPWTLYSIFFLYFPDAISNILQIILFCICMILFMAGVIGNFSLYYSLMTDCTPLKRRGSLFGYRTTFLAIGVLLMYPAARFVMNYWPEPNNFLVAFIIGNTLRMVACLIIPLVREHRDPGIQGDRRGASKMNHLIPRTRLVIRKMLRNPNYRVFLFFTVLFFVSLIMGSFIIVFAKETLGLSGSEVLTFTIVQMTAAALFSMILGKLADKIGYRTIGVIQGLILSCGFVILLVATLKSTVYVPAIYLGFFLYASMTSVASMVVNNLSIELLPKQNTATLIALANVLMMPAILVAMPLAGLVVDFTNSYIVVFAVGAAFAAISAVGFSFLVREPRERKMYVIKYTRRG